MGEHVENTQTSFDLESLTKINWGNGVYDLEAISKSYTLPILVRAMEGHYGNSDLSTFSTLDVLKLHKAVSVDLVLAVFERTDNKAKQASRSGQKDDHGLTVDMMDDKPVQICFPKDFCGLFQLASAGEKGKKYHSAVKLLKHMPKLVRVVKLKQEFPEDIQENDLLQILGEITEGDTKYLSVKRNKVGAEPSKMSMKCKGVFESVTDTKSYNLSEILQLFSLPLVVNLPKKSKHAVNVKSEVLSLLNHVGGTLTLQREVASEFFVASTTVQETPEQTTILVLSKNANVQFQIADDQENKDYKKVLESFGSVALKGIPQELFISEHGMPFVACLNYKKHTAQIKNPKISSHDIPPTPPPRPISTRQPLPLPDKIKSKLASAKLQEKQDTSSEGSDDSPLYDQINVNALGQRIRVRRQSPRREAKDNDYYASRHKPLIFQEERFNTHDTSPVSVRRNHSIALPCESPTDTESRRSSKVGRSSSDTQAKYRAIPMMVPRRDEIVSLRDNLAKVDRDDERNLTSSQIARHQDLRDDRPRLSPPRHAEGLRPLQRVRDEVPLSNNYRSRFHQEHNHADDDQLPKTMMPETCKRIPFERQLVPPPVSSCASTNIHAASTSYPADRCRRIPHVQISPCQDGVTRQEDHEEAYMNMDKRNMRETRGYPSHHSATTSCYFGGKTNTGSLPRSSRMVSQIILDPRCSQDSDYFVPTPRQLQRHRVEFSDPVSADGYIRMERGAHVSFEEQSRVVVTSANYINSPKQPLATITPQQAESARERSRSLDSILCAESQNQVDPPSLPPRPSNLANNHHSRSQLVGQLIDNIPRGVSQHLDHSPYGYASSRSHYNYLQQSPHVRSDNNRHQQSHNLENNVDRDNYQRKLPMRVSTQPDYPGRRLEAGSSYTVPRHANKHPKSLTAPELTLFTREDKKHPPPVPERSGSNYRRSSDLTDLTSRRSMGHYLEEGGDSKEDAILPTSILRTSGQNQSQNTRALPNIPQPPVSQTEDNQDDDVIYDDLAVPHYENDNFNVSSATHNQGIQSYSFPSPPSGDFDVFPPPPSDENDSFLSPTSEEKGSFLPPPSDENNGFIIPSSAENDSFLAPPSAEKENFLLSPSAQNDSFLLPPSAENDGLLFPPSAENDGFPPPPSDYELQHMLSTSPKLDTAARFTSKRQIPKDINQLSVSELSQCLRLLKVDSKVIDVLHQQQVDGTLLKHMSEDMIISLGVSEFQAKKLNLFAGYGWRPTSSSCDMEMLEYLY